jgi:fructose transport system permease protein
MTQVVEAPLPAEEILRTKPTVARRVHSVLHRFPALSPLVVLVVSFIVFSLVSSNFAKPSAISLLLQEVAVIGALAVGQTLIILTAGIDLSVGAVMVLAAFVMGKLALSHGAPGFLAFLVGVVIAVATGLLNGFLVTRLKLPPFIVTLGTLSVFTAISLIYAQGTTLSLSPNTFLTVTGKTFSIGSFTLTWGVVIMLLLYVGFSFALKQTSWGRHLYAVGDDPEASRLAGIRTNRVLLSAYVVAGAVFGIAAWIYIGRINGVDPNGGLNANLESITAVVIGGTSLFGGRGVVVGSLIGALIVQVFENGLSIAGVDQNYQVLTVGVLVIAAVAVDQWIRSVKS